VFCETFYQTRLVCRANEAELFIFLLFVLCHNFRFLNGVEVTLLNIYRKNVLFNVANDVDNVFHRILPILEINELKALIYHQQQNMYRRRSCCFKLAPLIIDVFDKIDTRTDSFQ
jgi:hypothetical protein